MLAHHPHFVTPVPRIVLVPRIPNLLIGTPSPEHRFICEWFVFIDRLVPYLQLWHAIVILGQIVEHEWIFKIWIANLIWLDAVAGVDEPIIFASTGRDEFTNRVDLSNTPIDLNWCKTFAVGFH